MEMLTQVAERSYSNPMCECISIAKQNVASITGFREPAAKGAIVSGTNAADSSLGKQSLAIYIVHSIKKHTFQMSSGSFHAMVKDLARQSISL